MKLTFLFAPTCAKANSLAYLEIKQLANNTEKNYILVPDRATLKTEIELIKSLSSSGVFNTQVLTINTLANLILGSDTNTLSTFGAQLLIKKIINENKNNLNCFSKISSNVNFAFELYKTIEQFKSSSVSIKELENIKNVPNSVLLKIKDIALIWNEYEKELEKSYSDGFSRINQLIKAVSLNKQFFANSNFLFLNFEKSTTQNLKVLHEITKYAKSTYVALPKANKDQQNSDIYDDSVYNNILSYANDNNIVVEEKWNSTLSQEEQNLLAFNLGYKKQKSPKEIELKSFEKTSDEISFVAQDILSKVAQGKRFDDFNVVVCDELNCLTQLKNAFDNNKIPYFVDEEINVSTHSLAKLVIALINCFNYNFQSDFVLQIVKNEFFGKEYLDVCNFENYVYKYGIEGAMFFADFKDEKANDIRLKLQKLIECYKKYTKASSASAFVDAIEQALAILDVEGKLESLIKTQEGNGELLLLRISEQIYEKILEVFSDVRQILQNSNCTKEEFKNLMFAGVAQKKISLIPVKTNSVYVGGFEKSYFEKEKINYIINANLNSFPSTQADVGIISDEEAESLRLKNKLDPSIKTLNKRLMFNAYDLICSSKVVIISYSKTVGEENASESLLAIDLKNIFELETQNYSSFDELVNIEKQEIISHYQAKNILAKELYKIKNGKPVLNKEIVEFLIKTFSYKENEQKKDFVVDGMLTNNEFSITKLERYFECPLKHFLLEVLKLRKREQCVIDFLDVGNIYHEWVRIFVLQAKQINEKNKKEMSLKIFDEILSQDKYAEIKEIEINKPVIKSMRKEIVKLADVLLTHLNNSSFTPKYLEKEFGNAKSLKSPILKSGNKNYFFKGKIDRIDVCEDYARVIDYKTGSDKFSYSKIFYGKKIQLVAYLMCASENNFKPVGAYYFPLKTQKTKSRAISKLDGVTLKDIDVILKSDTSLKPGEKSQLLDVKLNANRGFNGSVGKSTLLTEAEMDYLISYVNNLCTSALEEISGGNAMPSPLEIDGKLECDNCPFKGLSCCCDVNVRHAQNVSKDDFCKNGGLNE